MGAGYVWIMLSLASLMTTAVVRANDLNVKYPFRVDLLSDASRDYYTLHWTFSEEEKTIYFAVNVSTNGWVGFGLSPNGGMVNSDVVIGWISNGVPFFQVS